MVKLLILTVVVSLITRCSPELLCKKVILEISRNSQENTCARDSFLIKLQGGPATLSKKSLWHMYFPINFAKFLRTPFFYRTPSVAASVLSLSC